MNDSLLAPSLLTCPPPAAEHLRVAGAAMGELADLYAQTERALAGAGLTCWAGGACCRFDYAEHRLFVTTLELAGLLTVPPPPGPRRRLRCPYQQGPRCAAHHARPLGCRMHFCRDTGDRLEGLYEKLHRRITRLHERWAIPYEYRELTGWLAGMARIALTAPAGRPSIPPRGFQPMAGKLTQPRGPYP